MNEINPLKIGGNLPDLLQNSRFEKLENSTKNISEKNMDKIKETTEEFESFLLYYVLKSMRDTVPKSDFFHSNAEDIFTSMLDQEIAKNSAHRAGGLGLAQIMQQQLTNRGNQTLESRGLSAPKNKAP
jgi:flagellar protein FlgJ